MKFTSLVVIYSVSLSKLQSYCQSNIACYSVTLYMYNSLTSSSDLCSIYTGGAENDGHENDGPSKCPGMKLTDMKMTDMKMQDMFQVSE